MLFSTIGQFRVFLMMTAAGMLIGAWYALLAGLRRLMQAGFFLSLACDIAFGVGAAGIFTAFLVFANYGELRFFAVAAAILGWGLFAIGLLPPLRAVLYGTKRGLCRICCRIKQNRLSKVIFR